MILLEKSEIDGTGKGYTGEFKNNANIHFFQTRCQMYCCSSDPTYNFRGLFYLLEIWF